jgi:DNA replication protein DnaC
MPSLPYERVCPSLPRLQRPDLLARVDGALEEAAKQQRPDLDCLDLLLAEAIRLRPEKAVALKIRMARFPFVKTLEAVDCRAQPAVDERQVRELAALRFLDRGENLILLGPPGVGKTHLAVALGLQAIMGGYRVAFVTVTDLMATRTKAFQEQRFEARLRLYSQPKVLILEEMGSLPLDRLGATAFFPLVSRRYEKSPILLTSHKASGDWGSVFQETVLASAILDRLLHHSTTVNIRGERDRLREKRQTGLLPSAKGRQRRPAPVASSLCSWGMFQRPKRGRLQRP